MNKWSRYIVASIAKHITTQITGVHVYIEGQKRDTRAQTTWIEVRIDGPWIRRTGPSTYSIRVEVDVLCNVAKTSDAYKIQDLIGLVQAALDQSIVLYTYGETEVTQLGCLQQEGDIETTQFGQLNPEIEVTQATVMSEYRTQLEDI